MRNIAINFMFYFYIIRIYWHTRHFCWYNIHNKYNFITRNRRIIRNTFWIIPILTSTFPRIPTIIFFEMTIIVTFTLTRLIFWIIQYLIWITCCTFEFAFTITLNIFCHCFSFIFICYHIKYFNIYVFFFSFGTHIFGDKTLKLPLNLSRLTINR